MDGSTGRLKSALPSLAAGMLSVVVGDGLTKGSLRRKGRLGASSGTRAEGGRTGGERGEGCSLRRCCSTKIRDCITERRERVHGLPNQHTSTTFLSSSPFLFPTPEFPITKNHYKLSN